MSGKLVGKVAVITGGNSGIGLEVAKLFSSEGAEVALFGRDAATMDKAIKELDGSGLGYTGDVTSFEDQLHFVEKVRERYGRIDILFVNAGISKSIPVSDVTPEAFDEMFNINVKGAFYSVQLALPLMAKGSTITMTTSNVIHIGYPNLSLYSATKAAMSSLTKSFAAEFIERGIRVNSVSPGPIETPLLTKSMDIKTQQAVFSHIAGAIPMKRMGRPDEIAKAVLFLASDDSSFMTGEELIVDGGGHSLRT